MSELQLRVITLENVMKLQFQLLQLWRVAM